MTDKFGRCVIAIGERFNGALCLASAHLADAAPAHHLLRPILVRLLVDHVQVDEETVVLRHYGCLDLAALATPAVQILMFIADIYKEDRCLCLCL